MYRRYRRASQIAVFALMFAVPVLNLYEIYAITGTFYAINIGGLGIADPVVILQAMFAAGELTVPLLSAAIFPVLLALLLGRVWCGWMCPYHLLSDVACAARLAAATRILKKAEPASPAVKRSFSANMWRFGFLLVGTAAAGAIGIPVLNYLSAPGITSTEAMIFVKERTFSLEIGFIAVLLCLEFTLIPRFWCRFFCPTGAFLSLFRSSFTLRIVSETKNPAVPCCKESPCLSACPMGLQPYREGGNLLCTNCARCIDACPHQRLKFDGFLTARPR